MDQARRLWLGALKAHVRAVHSHEVAAALFERLGDETRAAVESQRAASERIRYADRAARHPEWSADVALGVVRVGRSDSATAKDRDD